MNKFLKFYTACLAVSLLAEAASNNNVSSLRRSMQEEVEVNEAAPAEGSGDGNTTEPRKPKTLLERQIEEYERIYATRVFLNYDKEEWDFSLISTSGIWRFGLETVLFFYFLLVGIYLVLILVKAFWPQAVT